MNDNKQALPVIFYAVEMEYPGKTHRVMVDGQLPSAGAFRLDMFPSIQITDGTDDANITLKFDGDKVSFYWNGVTSDKPKLRGTYYIFTFDVSSPRVVRMLRCAARFLHHLSRFPTNTSLTQALHVEFLRVKENKPSEENILQDNYATIELEDGETLGPYCLVIYNTTEFDLWPFVVTFDAAGLTIAPWYHPPLSADQPPLKAGQKLQVGCDDEQGLLLELWEKHPAMTYIRVFATKERTDFSSITQWWNSSTEDRVRGLVDPAHPSDDPPETRPIRSDTAEFEADKDQPNRTKFGSPAADWVAVTVTIVLSPKKDLDG